MTPKADYLLLYTDEVTGESGYKNQAGEIVIPLGKYEMCFTDTMRSYAIVFFGNAFKAIDRKENEMYEVFPFDNGPDYPSEGLFRILEKGKIGYADAVTGDVVVKPKYDCAMPFDGGKAQVSNSCSTEMQGEHKSWKSEDWVWIDKTGNPVK